MRFTLPSPSKSSLGFTIIELLVVFSIAVILSGSGYVALTSYSQKQALDQAVQDAKAAIDQAKFNAVSKTKPVTGCASKVLTAYQFLICTDLAECSYRVEALCDTQTTTVVTKKLPANISISQSTTCTGIEYNTLTGFVGTGCKIDFSGYGSVKTITVDNAGNASIQ